MISIRALLFQVILVGLVLPTCKVAIEGMLIIRAVYTQETQCSL